MLRDDATKVVIPGWNMYLDGKGRRFDYDVSWLICLLFNC